MDTGSIAGSLLQMRTDQTQQALAMTMMKQAANQQNMMANLLDQSVRQVSQPVSSSGDSFNFSIFA